MIIVYRYYKRRYGISLSYEINWNKIASESGQSSTEETPGDVQGD
jgi:hypothetical protein